MAVDLLDRPTALPSRSRRRPRRFRPRLGDLIRRPPIVPPADGDTVAVQDLLEEARAVVQRGWVQDAWYVVHDRRGRPRPVGPCHLGRVDHAAVTAACLVGAVLQAAWLRQQAGELGRQAGEQGRQAGELGRQAGELGRQTGERATAGAALDHLWHALHVPAGPVAPAWSPAERAARARDLSRWNDAPERRRREVLGLFDAAVLRAGSAPRPLQTTSV
jgi:hypothetical protein